MQLVRNPVFTLLALIVVGLTTAASAQADPLVISNGSFRGSVIGTSVNFYSFTGSAGDTASFSVVADLPPDVATNRGEPRLRLFDANGTLLAAAGGGPGTGFLFSFTQPGIYSLVVSSLSPFDPPFFNYTLTVSGLTAAVPTPEPATLILLSTGLAGAAAGARRRRGKRGNV